MPSYTQEERKNWKNMYIQILEKQDGKNLVGCVIGLGGGNCIYSLYKYLDIKMLYVIDPYVPMCMRETEEIIDVYIKLKPEAMKLLDEHKDTTTFIEDWAQNVADKVPDGLDFVWIDAFGLYDNNMKIFHSYYPKVRAGGVFAGKYYTKKWKTFRKALNDFEKEQGIIINKITGKRKMHNGDWWTVKPYSYDGLVGNPNSEGQLMEIKYVEKINPFKQCDKCGALMIGKERYCRKCKRFSK